jgi:hypothetical protein
MFQTAVVEKNQNTYMFNNFFSENRAVYEIMWKNMVVPETKDDSIYSACVLYALSTDTRL